ncbi:MAG: sulfatase-like hydrolase/transferase [Chitinophagaceae bacterium]|nr:sulfatase-like hydrolase/transferase [Chitinophagaceae bacterium]
MIISKSQKIENNYFPEINLNQVQSTSRPNIYFFLLDEYAGKTTLEKFYKYDNSNFYNELRKRKFYVAEKFSANYDKTPLCMASLFNMNYIKKETIYPFTTYNNYLKYFKAIKANPLFNFFQKHQIEIFNNSLFEINNTKKIFQFNNFPQVENLIHKDIFHIKLWKSFAYIFVGGEFNVPYFFEKWIMKNHRNNKNIFKESIKISKHKTAKQKFVYSHVMLPHAPYYCDSNGKVFSKKELGLKNKDAYIPYLIYTNKEILKLSDEIMKNDTNAILIYISDHGDRYAKSNSLKNEYNSHAFDNFFAIKTTSKNFENIKSNVNVFRVLLNTYFNQNLKMLNDTAFNFDERKNTTTVIEIK